MTEKSVDYLQAKVEELSADVREMRFDYKVLETKLDQLIDAELTRKGAIKALAWVSGVIGSLVTFLVTVAIKYFKP